jgi:hypothetical protein
MSVIMEAPPVFATEGPTSGEGSAGGDPHLRGHWLASAAALSTPRVTVLRGIIRSVDGACPHALRDLTRPLVYESVSKVRGGRGH